jgi:starch synthase
LPLRPRSLLLGSIGRLDRQKGADLIAAAMPELAASDIQLALLGSGSPELETLMRQLAENHPQQVAVTIGYDEALAHLIEAGADVFLMPSIYEPCGLNQMYSHRYGTLPLVRETGGLKDTVVDLDRDPRQGNGFTFAEPTPAALADAVRRAAQLYFTNRRKFNATARRAMGLDHSWANIAQRYRDLYLGLLSGQPMLEGAA